MRAVLAKATRRQMRRALGPDTVTLLSAQHEGLTDHAAAIELLIGVVFGRSILGRLRWLLFGR